MNSEKIVTGFLNWAHLNGNGVYWRPRNKSLIDGYMKVA
jgi:hypothetical protein